MIPHELDPPTMIHVLRMTDRDIVNGALREMPYEEYLRTNHWQEVRAKALKRAGYRCSVCLAETALDVHHINYDHRGDERSEDVVALCRACHKIQHETLRHIIHAEQERLSNGR